MFSRLWSGSRRFGLALLLLFICAVYANHFENSFHFDDAHAVTDNPSIRSLQNIPSFFTDASTFSVLPANRAWRPLVSTSLALDYWLAGGLKPVAFHLSTFLWYLIQIALMFFLFERLFDLAFPHRGNRMLALLAAGWYGLNPACAETVNYVIQRGDLYSTLGVVAGLYLFVAHPEWRRFGLYLAPVAAALLSKPPALVFPALLFAYVTLFEDQRPAALRRCAPALLLSAALGLLHVKMTPSTFVAGASSAFAYRITQPYVALRYFLRFFLPLDLSADGDMEPIPSASDPHVIAGFVFLAAILAAAIFCSRNRKTAPAALGLWWFLIALVPTSLFALAEVENDHRMFFPCVGLAMGVVWALGLLWRRETAPAPVHRAVLLAVVLGLAAAYGWGTHQRNRVWKDEASLWKDVTIKSPRNGRGWMNYGLTRMSSGDIQGALDAFHRALVFTPSYYVLEINLGIAYGQIGKDAEAELHFERALSLAPVDALPYYFYARWLDQRGRIQEALTRVRTSVTLNPSNEQAQALLAKLQALGQGSDHILAEAERSVATNPSAEAYLNISLLYHQARRYQDCIRMAQEALRRKPDYPEAYNNIAAGYEAMGRWDEAIEAAREALRLKPDFQLARNNLAWSESQKVLAAGKASRSSPR
jgi:protein O-mannosyl-transferase